MIYDIFYPWNYLTWSFICTDTRYEIWPPRRCFHNLLVMVPLIPKMWICKELTSLGIVQYNIVKHCLHVWPRNSLLSPAMLFSAACHDRVRAWAKLQSGPGLTNGGAARQSADQSEIRWGRISQSVISCGDAWAGCLLLSYKQLLIGMTYCHAQRWTHPPLPACYPPASGMPYTAHTTVQ